MIKILIVENDRKQQELLHDLISLEYPDWNVVCATEYQNASTFIQNSLKDTAKFSLFLLAEQLNTESTELEGFRLANEIRSKKQYRTTPLLFLAPSPDHIQQAISEYHCYNYLVQPYSPTDIMAQIEEMRVYGMLSEEVIHITDTSRIQHRIPVKNICYIEAKSHQVQIATPDAIITTRKVSFTTLQERLANELIPCHKKYLVNLHHISNYDKSNRMLLVHTYHIPVSRNYKADIETVLK